MKTFILFLALALPLMSHADLEHCSAAAIANPTAKKAVEFLQSIQGRYQFGRCHIELTVCSSDPKPPPGDDMVIGDLSVIDERGQQFYLVLDMNQTNTQHVAKVILDNPRMVHYEDIEILDGPEGHQENYRLEIVKTPDLKHIESLDLGIYTSVLIKKYPQLQPGRSYWVNCYSDPAVAAGRP